MFRAVAQVRYGRAAGRAAGASEGMREMRSCVSRLRADGAGAARRGGRRYGPSIAAGAARVLAGRRSAAIRDDVARGCVVAAAESMAGDVGGGGDLRIREQRGVSFDADAE